MTCIAKYFITDSPFISGSWVPVANASTGNVNLTLKTALNITTKSNKSFLAENDEGTLKLTHVRLLSKAEGELSDWLPIENISITDFAIKFDLLELINRSGQMKQSLKRKYVEN